MAGPKKERRKPEPRKLYHVGTRDTCALQNAGFGGITLPRFTEKRVGKDEDAVLLRREGDYVHLTDAHAKFVRDEIDRHVHRVERTPKGQIVGGGFIPWDAPYYEEREDDEPAETQVYMVEATEEQERRSWGAPQPPLAEPDDGIAGREPDVLERTPSAARAIAAAAKGR